MQGIIHNIELISFSNWLLICFCHSLRWKNTDAAHSLPMPVSNLLSVGYANGTRTRWWCVAGCVTSAYNFTGQDVEERP